MDGAIEPLSGPDPRSYMSCSSWIFRMMNQLTAECSSAPIRVLHVLDELRPSGAEVMLKVAAEHFQNASVQCDILSTGAERVGDYAGVLDTAGYRVHHLAFRRSPRFFWTFSRFVRAGRYDVVHLHGEAATLWFALASFPWSAIVRTVHSNFSFTGTLRLRRIATRWLSRLIGVSHLAISPSVQRNESSRLYNPSILAPNWYDDIRFCPPLKEERDKAREVFGLTPDQFAIVSVGNCAPVKNHRAVIEAVARLSKKMSLIYLHVGEEDSSCSERVLADQFGVGEKIRFLGHQSDVREALFAGDCFVMPSFYEGFGIAALEAVAVGLPVILSDIPAFRDWEEGFENIHYCRSDAIDLADQIQRASVLTNDKRLSAASKNNEVARLHFEVPEVLSDIALCI